MHAVHFLRGFWSAVGDFCGPESWPGSALLPDPPYDLVGLGPKGGGQTPLYLLISPPLLGVRRETEYLHTSTHRDTFISGEFCIIWACFYTLILNFLKNCQFLTFFEILSKMFFQHYESRGYQKSSDKKNSPEMDELERDISPLQFLASNFEKQKF